MKIIVTGGAGFIGSAVCRYLISNTNYRVTNVDKLAYASSLSSVESIATSRSYHFVQADVCNQTEMGALLVAERPDAIIHSAAETHVDRSINSPADFIETNVRGTFSMLEATRSYLSGLSSSMRDRFRFLHVSTDEVYGSLDADGLFSERTPYDPSSPYSATKAAADHLAMAWHRTYALPVIVSNCSNNYGPYQFPEKLIPLTILNALAGKSLPIYGNGSNIRDWIYVDDHVKALHKIVSNGVPGTKYNIGGRNERSNLEVVQNICEILDRLAPKKHRHADLISFVTDRPAHDRRYAIDCSKLESELEWKPKESFDSGLEKTVTWYLENESWWQPMRDKKYAGERLGLLDSPRLR